MCELQAARTLKAASQHHCFAARCQSRIFSLPRYGNAMSIASTCNLAADDVKAGNGAADGCTRALQGELHAAMLPVSHLPRRDAECRCQVAPHGAGKRRHGERAHPDSRRMRSHAAECPSLPMEGAAKAVLKSAVCFKASFRPPFGISCRFCEAACYHICKTSEVSQPRFVVVLENVAAD